MQLNLNKKQRVNFSMMSRKFLIVILLLSFAIYLKSVSVSANDLAGKLQEQIEKDTQPVISDKKEDRAEILLLHNEVLTDSERDNIMLISNMATSMVKGLEFGTYEQYQPYLGEYSYIICYNLKNVDSTLAETLRACDAKIFLIGSEIMLDYLKSTGQAGLLEEAVEPTTGILHYSFENNAEFEELIQFHGISQSVATEYRSGIIEVGDKEYPFCSQIAKVRFVTITDFTGELSYAAMLKELATWLWPYKNDPVEYVQYVVLDAVDAFMPVEQLKEKVELLISQSLSFVISVMPVYQNTEYPAMQQFCEVLRYAQDNGGAVIMHAPIQQGTINDWEEFSEKMTAVTIAYSDYGVYPLGIEIPQSWIYKKDMLEWLKRYKTVFVYQDDGEIYFHEEDHKNLLYYNYHNLVMPMIELDDTGISYVKNYASALFINGNSQDNSELIEKINNYMQSSVSTKSLWELPHSVWANNYHLNYENGVLTINDEIRSIIYIPQEYDENFNYKRNVVQRVTVNIKNQSTGLILLVTIVTTLFLGMIGYARYHNRKRFFGKKSKGKEKCE